MPFNGNVGVAIAASYTSTVDIGTVEHSIAYNPTRPLSDGTGANQAKAVFADERTLAASGTENLDLAGGLTDAFGASLTFTKIRALIVEAAASNTNDVVLGGAASNGWVGPFGATTHTVAVKPGGVVCLIAPDANGYGVTAGTGDILKVTNSAGGSGVTYKVTIIGTT